MRTKLRNFIKYYFRLYDIEDLTIGAHCGCCGKWISGIIAVSAWPWDLCDKCKNGRGVGVFEPQTERSEYERTNSY